MRRRTAPGGPRTHRRRLDRSIAARAALAMALLAAGPAAGGDGAAAADAGPPSVRFVSDETVVEAGRTRIIHFRAADAAVEDVTLPARSSDAAVLRLLDPPRLLAGEALGTVRVAGAAPGVAELTVADAVVRVRVEAADAADGEAAGAPRIVGPAAGAVLWGEVAIGVEEPLVDGSLRTVLVYVGDQMVLLPEEDSARTSLPMRRLRYAFDAAALPDGIVLLRPVAIDGSGREHAGAAVAVQIAHPFADRITAIEAERSGTSGGPYGNTPLVVRRDPAASGGQYVVNATPVPPVSLPVTVRTPGWYQLMVVARGTRAKGALPMIAVAVDGAPGGEDFVTNGRVLGEHWHRVAVGIPFRLDAGRHLVTPLFANDLEIAGIADRDLHVDRLEVARVTYTDPRLAAGSGPERGAPATLADPYGLSSEQLRISVAPPAAVAEAPGLVAISGRVWSGADDGAAPDVTLVVAGEAVTSQRSRAPHFWLDAARLGAAAASVQLVARSPRGPVATTPALPVPFAEASARPPRRCHRYTVLDPRWGDGLAGLLVGRPDDPERSIARFTERRAATLSLPADLSGSFDVFLDASAGGNTAERPVISVSLFDGRGVREIGRGEVPAANAIVAAGSALLAPGDKRLVVRFENPSPSSGASVDLRAVRIAERPTAPDRVAPRVELAYPPPGHPVHLADGVVAVAQDDVLLSRLELLVDGHATGLSVDVTAGEARAVLPLLARALPAGPHEVAVRAIDASGNATLSAPRRVVVRTDAPATLGPYRRAVRLLDRFGYGPDPRELADVLALGETEWLEDRLQRSIDEPSDLAALGDALRRFPGMQPNDVTGRVLSHLLTTPNPARARMVLWAENHFSTWIRKTGAESKWAEHVAFARLGPARFDRLLLASARSPAMLVYLDQTSSYVGRLNENYAREIMELHTVGVDGGYDQEDVTNLAHVLTGWTAALDGDGRSGGPAGLSRSFRFDAALNDAAPRRVFGIDLSEAQDGNRFERAVVAIEHLAAHPRTARAIARKMAAHYVAVPAPAGLVGELESVFHESGGDLRAMLRSIAGCDGLYAPDARRMTQPIDYVVRLFRISGHDDPERCLAFLGTSGQGLFGRSTPDGYPDDDAAYADTNAMVQRWRLALDATTALAALVPAAWRDGSAAGPDAAARWGAGPASWEQAVVDVIAVRLTGDVLSPRSNRAALDVLAAHPGAPGERIRVVAPLIAQLPEANLR